MRHRWVRHNWVRMQVGAARQVVYAHTDVIALSGSRTRFVAASSYSPHPVLAAPTCSPHPAAGAPIVIVPSCSRTQLYPHPFASRTLCSSPHQVAGAPSTNRTQLQPHHDCVAPKMYSTQTIWTLLQTDPADPEDAPCPPCDLED